jgi:hypothetical protein
MIAAVRFVNACTNGCPPHSQAQQTNFIESELGPKLDADSHRGPFPACRGTSGPCRPPGSGSSRRHRSGPYAHRHLFRTDTQSACGGTKLSKGDLALAKICADWPEARDTMSPAMKSRRRIGHLPKWARRTKSLDALLPILYLRGMSGGPRCPPGQGCAETVSRRDRAADGGAPHRLQRAHEATVCATTSAPMGTPGARRVARRSIPPIGRSRKCAVAPRVRDFHTAWDLRRRHQRDQLVVAKKRHPSGRRDHSQEPHRSGENTPEEC